MPDLADAYLYRHPKVGHGRVLLGQGPGAPVLEMVSRVRAGDEPAAVADDFGVRPESLRLLVQLADEFSAAPTQREKPTGDECDRPPAGWRCTREPGHEDPCAAVPAPSRGEQDG